MISMQLKEELGFMGQYGLTPAELLLVKMAFLRGEGIFGAVYVQEYLSLHRDLRGDLRSLVQSLKDKRVVLQEYRIPDGKIELDGIPFNKNFVKRLFRSSNELGKELYDAYPLSTTVDGREYKLRRVSKRFDSLEHAFFAYGRAIRWNEEQHARVLQLVEAGKRNGYSFSTLDSFIVDNDWLNLEALNDRGQLMTMMRML